MLKSRGDVPPGLNHRAIGDWLSGASKSAREDHLLFVLDAWRALPRAPYVVIDATRRAELRALQEHSGIGPYALLAGRRDRPAGLRAATVSEWLHRGTAKAQCEHYEYVVSRWREADKRIDITEEIAADLRAEKERSGVGTIALLKYREDVPHGLNADIIDGWLSGRIQTARTAHVAFVLRSYRQARERP